MNSRYRSTAVVRNAERYWRLRGGRHHPCRSASPADRRGRDSPSAVMPTRRAGCIDRCSSGSTEAHRSNPRLGAWSDDARHARVIPVFYPIERSSRSLGNRGDREKPRAMFDSLEAVVDEAGENPARGVRTQGVRSTRLAWGASDLVTGGTDSLTGVGDPRQIRGPRKAQLRKARKGLPVIPIGAGAEQRTSHTEG